MKTRYYITLMLLLCSKFIFAQDGYIGEVRLFAGNFEPKGWAFCNGQKLTIASNTALFSILGTTYGGDGRTTFGLPDLRERTAIGLGQGTGLSNYSFGKTGGVSTVILTTNNLPAHSHGAQIKVSSSTATSSVPTTSSSLAAPVAVYKASSRSVLPYAASTANTTLSNTTTQASGNATAVTIEQPYLVCNYIICVQGIFPARN